MKQTKFLLSNIIAAFAIASCGGGGSSASSTTPANSNRTKVSAYVSNGMLYKYDLYLGNGDKPSYSVKYVSDSTPHTKLKRKDYPSLTAFLADKANLDARFKSLKNTSSNLASISNTNVSPKAGTSNGLAVGYIPSVGAILYGSGNNECYYTNPTIDTTTATYATSFNVTNSTFNHSSMHSPSFSVSGMIDGLEISDTPSYTSSNQGSAASGLFTLGSAVAAVVNTGVPLNNNMSINGVNTFNASPGTFFQNCGSAALTGYVGGILTTLDLQVITNSNSVTQSFSNTVTGSVASESAVSVSLAFTNSEANSSSFTNVTMNYTSYGDVLFNPSDAASANAPDYTTYIANALLANQQSYVQCNSESPVLSSCSSFNTAMTNAINQGAIYANNSVSSGNGASTLYAFPYGINLQGSNFTSPQVSVGVYVSYVDANSKFISSSPIDPFSQNLSGLENAVQLTYALNSLAKRAALLGSLPGLYTNNEQAVLNNLANYYSNDAKNIQTAITNCYQATIASYESNPSVCSNTISLANGGVGYSFSNLPNNPYQAYPQNSSNPLVDLLLINSVALQYQIQYNEVGTGVWNSDMIRAGNQIAFGLAYFNQQLSAGEYSGQTSLISSGYILPNISAPILMSPNGAGYYNQNSNTTFETSTQWGQPYGSSPVSESVTYPDSPLYFVLYDVNSNPLNLLPIGQSVDNMLEIYSVGINKVIGNNILTTDSQSMLSNGSGYNSWFSYAGAAFNFPTLNQLANGAILPSYILGNAGQVTGSANGLNSNSSANAAATCLNGVFLPDLNSQTATISNGYGWPRNVYNYICYPYYTDGANTWFTLNATTTSGKTSNYEVSNIEEDSFYNFSPIPNFFGFSFSAQ